MAFADSLERPRGRLRIYFGAAPGVGKTFAMLSDARVRRARGADVVIGLVDAHGLADTEALLKGFEAVAPRQSQRSEPGSRELDLDAVIERRPALVLIDDLQHRNPEGSRHFQRWQDIEEILDQGVDVHTTLSVQSIESLKELIHELTKIRFRQTVPDSVFEQADEVTLVDISPDDLLERLRDGKVFLAQPDRMLRDFFRKETLVCLRDLALRQAAAHLEAQRLAQSRKQAGGGLWPGSKKVLVCIGHEPVAERLIHAGRRLASLLHADWIVAYQESAKAQRIPERERERVQAHLRLAEDLGAEVVTLAGYAMDRRVVELAQQKNVGRIVLERPSGTVWQRWRSGAIVRTLEREARDLDVFLVSAEHSPLTHDTRAGHSLRSSVTPASAGRLQPAWGAYLWSAGVTAAATILSTAAFRHPEPTNHLIIYLVGVLFIASRFGFWPSAVAALLSVLAADYLLVPPYFSFAIARPQDVVTLGVFLLAALVASRLTDNLRFQTERARQREQRVRFLYEFTKALAAARSTEQVAAVAQWHMSNELPWRSRLLLADADGKVVPAGQAADSAELAIDPEVAQWSFDNSKPAGWGTDTMRGDRGLYLPVSSASHRFGVLALRPEEAGPVLLPEQRRMIDTLVTQISGTLERIRLAREANTATARVESESLRNSLLSAIAHDFRTPLASIVAASSTLLESKGRLSDYQEHELTQTIFEEGQRMTNLANNTLEMARLEAGAVTLTREWYPLDEIVGAVISHMEDRLKDHPIETRLPAGVPMAQVDEVMIVQVLENLIENAIKYTPAGTRIEVGAQEEPGQIRFWVADEGPGLAPGDDRKIFEKFYRGAGRETRNGVGLGLTICQIIVQAHGGQIVARNRPAGGAEFLFTIPSTEPPPQIVPEE